MVRGQFNYNSPLPIEVTCASKKAIAAIEKARKFHLCKIFYSFRIDRIFKTGMVFGKERLSGFNRKTYKEERY